MSIIIAPDSFKGSISAREFCDILAPLCAERAPGEQILCLPLADGGEGTLDCVLCATGGEKEYFSTVDALGAPIEAPVGFLPDGAAVIEVATVIGLPQLRGREDPMKASTYGLGILIKNAIEKGASAITLTLGGSATNDLGLGMLAALGWEFFDQKGAAVAPCGEALERIAAIQRPAVPIYENVTFTAMCDVKNPLLGKEGCAAVYAPQKGASAEDMARLEAGAKNVASLWGGAFDAPGAGAAGGLGYACLGFLGGALRPGIEEVLRLYRFDKLLKDCRLLITGEGCFDGQSAMGKAVGTLIQKSAPVPAIVFAGMVKPFDKARYPNLKEVYAISEGLPLEVALRTGKENLRRSFNDSKLPYPYTAV